MSFWVGLLVGMAIGIAAAAFLIGRSQRRELEEQAAWQRQAREVLREVGLTSHYPGWLRQQARRLLADEAGA